MAFCEAAWAELKDRVPVAIVWGSDDCIVPALECIESLGRCLPNAPLVFIQEAGHGLLLENTEEVAQHALSWFCDGRFAGSPVALYAEMHAQRLAEPDVSIAPAVS